MDAVNYMTSRGDYRYAFNGKEKDVSGLGDQTHYDYGFRIYNPEIARFLSVDPLTSTYSFYTPYQFAGNSPIASIDLDGLERSIRISWTSIQGVEGHRYITDKDEMEEYLITNAFASPSLKTKWFSSKHKEDYLKAKLDKEYLGIYAGDLEIELSRYREHNIAYFDGYEAQRKQAITDMVHDRKFQAKKWQIQLNGAADMVSSTITIVGLATVEVGSGLLATTAVVVPALAAMDNFSDGYYKLVNPREAFDGQEFKPVKYLITEILGKNGEELYTVIDLATGIAGVPDADNIFDIYELFNTIEDAQEYIKKRELSIETNKTKE